MISLVPPTQQNIEWRYCSIEGLVEESRDRKTDGAVFRSVVPKAILQDTAVLA